MNATMKTQTIAGHQITLAEGVRYRASRRMVGIGRIKGSRFTVSICDEIDGQFSPIAVEKIWGLTYDQANEFINEFNNGPTSFEGRAW